MIYQKFLTETLKSASRIADRMFGKVSGKLKVHDPKQVLTEADLAVGKFIINEIGKNYPEHNIIDEEAGIINKNSEYTWVVDPIDGTANFAVGIPLYGIMIGLLKEDKPFAGGFSLPYFNEIYVADKNQGAVCNGKKLEIRDRNDFLKILVAYGIERDNENSDKTRDEAKYLADIALEFLNIRDSGSIYDTAMLAKGAYGACLYYHGKIWDNVAQQIIIEEAGGVYTDFYGEPMDYSNPLTKTERNYTYCAAAPAVHKKLQEIIHSVK